MDLCHQDLSKYTRELIDMLDERTLLLYLLQLVIAVGHLHDNGIAHRDIKADNIMLHRVGEIRLIDFGCSCKTLFPSNREGNPANMR